MSLYDTTVLADAPALFLSNVLWAADDAPTLGSFLPNGEQAMHFDGVSSYIEISDANALSITTTGELTVEAWIQPTTLTLPHVEGSGYVHWLGKGEAGQQEYTMRMYSSENTENRDNRISAYAFDKTGGIGPGSYFQDRLIVGNWIYIVATFTPADVTIWRDGLLRDTDPVAPVVVENGTAPLRIGTRDKASFFKGNIGKVAIYNHLLTSTRILAHFDAMRAG